MSHSVRLPDLASNRVPVPNPTSRLQPNPTTATDAISPLTRAMGRAKKVAAEAVTAVTAVADGAAAAATAAAAAVLPASAGPSGGADSTESISVKSGLLSPRQRVARLPGPVQFALAVGLSFALSSLGRSFVGWATQNEAAGITREAGSKSEVFAPAAWRLYVTFPLARVQLISPSFPA